MLRRRRRRPKYIREEIQSNKAHTIIQIAMTTDIRFTIQTPPAPEIYILTDGRRDSPGMKAIEQKLKLMQRVFEFRWEIVLLHENYKCEQATSVILAMQQPPQKSLATLLKYWSHINDAIYLNEYDDNHVISSIVRALIAAHRKMKIETKIAHLANLAEIALYLQKNTSMVDAGSIPWGALNDTMYVVSAIQQRGKSIAFQNKVSPPLTKTEIRVFEVLKANANNIVAPITIATFVFGEKYTADKTDQAITKRVSKAISDLKLKVDQVIAPHKIVCSRGAGYMLRINDPCCIAAPAALRP